MSAIRLDLTASPSATLHHLQGCSSRVACGYCDSLSKWIAISFALACRWICSWSRSSSCEVLPRISQLRQFSFGLSRAIQPDSVSFLEFHEVDNEVVVGLHFVPGHIRILCGILTGVIYMFHEVRHVVGRGLLLVVETTNSRPQGRSTVPRNTMLTDLVVDFSWGDDVQATRERRVEMIFLNRSYTLFK
jgi:hypothetical protein